MNEQISKEKNRNELLYSKIFVLENEIVKRKSESDLLKEKLSKIKKLDEIFLFVNEVFVCNPSSSLLAINDELIVYKEAYNKIIESYKTHQCNILKYQRIIQEMKIEIHSLKSKIKEKEPEKPAVPVDPEADSPKEDQSEGEEVDINEMMKSDFLGIRGLLNQDIKSNNSIIGTKRSQSLNFLTNDIIKRDYNPEGNSDLITPIQQMMMTKNSVRNEGICFESLRTLNLLPEDRQTIKDFVNKVNLKVLEKTKRITELEQLIEQQKARETPGITNTESSPAFKPLKKTKFCCNIQRNKRPNQKASNSDSSSNKDVENAIIDTVLNNISARKIHRNGSSMITINKVKINSLNHIQHRSDTPQERPYFKESSENSKPVKQKVKTLNKLQPSLFFEKLKDRNIKINISESAIDSKFMNSQANCSSIKNRVMSRLNLKLKEK